MKYYNILLFLTNRSFLGIIVDDVRKAVMKVKNNYDLAKLVDIGFEKDNYGNYYLRGRNEDNFIFLKASVNSNSRNIWISDKDFIQVNELVKDICDK